MLIIGAYRDVDPTLTDPLRTMLSELAREPVTRALVLVGLDEADVARFIQVAAPGAPAADMSAAVHAKSEGNPLFLGEIVRLLAAERRLDESATAPLAIPQSVREVIGRRLRHLRPNAIGFSAWRRCSAASSISMPWPVSVASSLAPSSSCSTRE